MTLRQTTEPHPNWIAGHSDRHPASEAEWDYRNDPTGGAFDRSLRRLQCSVDYDDPRAPDQMTQVLRIDLLRILHDLYHKRAVFEMWLEERKEKSAVADGERVPQEGK